MGWWPFTSSTIARTAAPPAPPVAPADAAKPKKKICCACPETKAARDECVALHGPESKECAPLIEAHKLCLRAEGFNAQGWGVDAAVDFFYSSGMSGHADRGPKVDRNAIQRLYERYKDDDRDMVGVDGISQFCSDLDVAPDDVVVLVLSWHFKAETMCEYSQDEFTSGMASLGCDSMDKLRAKLPALREELQDTAKYREIYQFAFMFSREKGQKCVMLDVAVVMWQLIVPPTRWRYIGDWCGFLQTHHKRAVSRDTWNQLLDFLLTTNEDFSNYDDAGAWPYLIDEFVEHMRKVQQQQNGSAAMED